jgi:hypothetical protein
VSLLKKIKVLFVFDGILPDYKVNQRHERNQNLIDLQAEYYEQIKTGVFNGCDTLLPPFALFCLIHTLVKNGIETVLAQEDADYAISKLAKKRNAIVISQDSDFFMYNIKGYIPITSLEWKQDHITGTVYSRSHIASLFGIRVEYLPIMAVLGGCDHFSNNDLLDFFRANYRLFHEKTRINERYNWIIELLQSLDSDAKLVVEEVCELLEPEWKDKIHKILLESLDQYHLLGDDKVKLLSFKNSYIEDINFLVESLMIHPKILEMIDCCFWCRPIFEDPAFSGYEISLFIRMLTYRLICPGKCLIEHYQNGNNMTSKSISGVAVDLIKCATIGLDDVNILQISNLQDLIVIALRYYAYTKKEVGSSLCNYELVGLLTGMIVSSRSTMEMKTTTKLTCKSLQLSSHLECIMYCLSMYIPLIKQIPMPWFYQCLQGPIIHDALQKAKGGSSPTRILKGSMSMKEFTDMYYRVCSDIFIVQTMAYEFETSILLGK